MENIPSIENQLKSGLREVQAIKSGKINMKSLRVSKREELSDFDAEHIKELRETTLNVSQAVLASALHVSPKTVQAWEIGNSKPSGPSQVLLNLMESLPQVRNKLINA